LVFTIDRTITPIVNWTHRQSASSLSVFGAYLLVDPTSIRSTPPYASNSTNDADGIAMPAVATLPSCHTDDSSLRFGANIDGPSPPAFSVFGADPSVDPTSMQTTRSYVSNPTDDVGGLSYAESLERAFALSMGEGGGHMTFKPSQSQNKSAALTKAKDKDWLLDYPNLMDILEKFEPSQTYTAGDVVPKQIPNEAFDKLLTFLQGINFEFVNQYQLEQTLRLVAS